MAKINRPLSIQVLTVFSSFFRHVGEIEMCGGDRVL